MDANEYIEQRLEDQIGWYDRKSQWNQRWYKRLRLAEIVAAALIPFLAAWPPGESWVTRVVIGLLGVLIAVVAAAIGLYQLQENWVKYRTTCESLKKERYLYLTATKPYDGDEAARLQLLVRRVEALVSQENTEWAESLMQPKEESGGG